MAGSSTMSASGGQHIDLALDSAVAAREDDDVFDVHPDVVVEQDVPGDRTTSAESSKVENSPTMKYSLKEQPGVNAIAAETGPCTDEVDGDATKLTRTFADLKESNRKSSQNQIDYRDSGTSIPLNLPADFLIPSSVNEDNFNNLKKLCRPLTVQIKTENSKGSGTLVHPKIWQTFGASRRLGQISLLRRKAKSASLMIKTSNKLIATDADAATAVVEITLYHDDEGRRHILRFRGCSKGCYDIEDCSLLVCHNVPMDVCEFLEKTYKGLCRLADSMSHDVTFSKAFLLIGHRNGDEIVTSQITLRDGVNLQDYEYLSLEESAEHFFTRTMTMTPEEWSNVKEKFCPGDESISVIRFAEGCLY